MNPYEGLNLPQLMELLHGLAVPEPVSWVPQTPGWWIAFGWLVAVAAIIIAATVRHRRRNKYRRQAEVELATIERQAEDDRATAAADLAALLKRTALVAYPRTQVASLFGGDWARFLVASSNGDPKVAGVADDLARVAYRNDVDVRELVPAARRWIRRHRA